jgi:hypothetical protein
MLQKIETKLLMQNDAKQCEKILNEIKQMMRKSAKWI